MSEARQHLEQAYGYEAEANHDLALRECEAAIQLDPTLAEAHNLRGIILDQLGRTEQAVAAYTEAIRLNPDFDEAQQNLLEARRDNYQTEHLLYTRRLFKAAWQGALAYATSFALLAIITAVLGSGLLVGSLLLALASGLGAAALWKVSQPRSSFYSFVGLGALGFGLAYLLTANFYESPLLMGWIAQHFDMEQALWVASTLRFGLIGACTGALLGASQWNWRPAGGLALAGAIGFGSYGVWSELLYQWVIRTGITPESPAIILVLFGTARYLIMGGISGMLLGLVQVWVNRPVPPAEIPGDTFECSACGASVAEEATSCPHCGADLGEVEAVE